MEKEYRFCVFENTSGDLIHQVVLTITENNVRNNYILNLSIGLLMPFSHIFSYLDRVRSSGFKKITMEQLLDKLNEYQIINFRTEDPNCELVCKEINNLINNQLKKM